jgi:hypothetical protein
MLAAESAALPLASMRKGPISQSVGMARTTKKTKIKAAKKSRKPNRRRRRRFDSSREPGSPVVGTAVRTGPAGAKMVSAVVVTGSVAATLTTGSAGTAATTGSAGAATGTEAVTWTAGFVSVFAGWIGALASGAAPPPVSLSSRSCSFA